MIDFIQFRDEILRPVLSVLQMEQFELLLIGTMAHESKGGTYLKQTKGSALGVFQMEPKTHDDIWNNYLPHQPIIAHRLMQACNLSTKPTASMLTYHLRYAAAMTAIDYQYKLKGKTDLGPYCSIENCAKIWKEYYNTPEGRGTVEEFINDYKLFTGVKEAVYEAQKKTITKKVTDKVV